MGFEDRFDFFCNVVGQNPFPCAELQINYIIFDQMGLKSSLG